MYLISPLPLPPQILHNLSFSFLLGNTIIQREIENNAYAKFWGQIRCIVGECKWRTGVVDYNLVPFSHEPQGSLSLTSGKIRKKSLIGPAIKTCSSLANFFANQNL